MHALVLVDGGFSVWTDWDTCTSTCGGGTQARTRDCSSPTPAHGGANCSGDTSESQSCNEELCPGRLGGTN